AGGEGRRLAPLTNERAKPAVPFGGRYRIIDFVLSNFANSGVLQMKVLTQYKSDSLNKHISRGWHMSHMLGQFVESVPAQMRTGPEWYKGSADAIYQNLNLVTDEEPDYVFVFGADHVYRMDMRQVLEFHQKTGADCTVAAIPVPLEQASQFGVITADKDGRMTNFLEKPTDPKPMIGDPTKVLASMGNYLFTTEALVREIVRDAGKEGAHDFGKSIISEMFKHAKVFVYDFAKNKVPGQSEREAGYWRDVGDLETYYEANMDLVDVDPQLSLYNARWPIYTAPSTTTAPAKFVFNNAASKRVGAATDSLVSDGCIVSGGFVNKSVLSSGVRVNSYSEVTDSILFEGVNVGRHAKIRRAIIDKNVEIPPGMEIGYDPEEDKRRFHVTQSGIVVVPKGMRLTE
ncbi:MAG TPA: glucose-1-phosphate adenylyltransferase, partial [Solirubrobacterales bacterium]|nr:glucose-1-phosphate adenylyltransferase [Solirubrobacterales bacterium]